MKLLKSPAFLLGVEFGSKSSYLKLGVKGKDRLYVEAIYATASMWLMSTTLSMVDCGYMTGAWCRETG